MLSVSKSTKAIIEGNKIDVDNTLFYVIESYTEFKLEHMMGYDALIIDAQDNFFTRHILKKLRSSFNHEYYLKPIFLLNPRETNDPIVKGLNDGIIFSLDQVTELTNKVKQLFFNSTQISYNTPLTFEAQVVKKVFDYMFTRDIKSLTPMVDMNSSVGFSWPEISVNFEAHEDAQVLEILDYAEREGYVWPDFEERVYLCNNCYNGYLMYREVCPHCNSSHISSQDLVHHFPCAYVGPIADFKNTIDNTLSCPKCHKNLRHIGVDYDKPSVINHCNSCDKSFQDFYIKAKCLSCSNDVEVQYLISKNIYKYKLTKKGRAVAVSGMMNAAEVVEEIQGTIALDTYKIMLHYQIERMRNNKSLKSFIMIMNLENIFELYNKIGNKAYRKLLEDIVMLVRENITPSDYISIESQSTMHLCLNDVEPYHVDYMVRTITHKLKKTIADNFNNFELVMRIEQQQLQSSTSADKQIIALSKILFE
jgi:hypothetical protein